MKINPFVLIIPGTVFVIVFVILLFAMPKPEKIATAATPTPSPTTQSVDQTKPNPYQDLYNQISGFTPDDPNLTAPNFDRSINLPSE